MLVRLLCNFNPRPHAGDDIQRRLCAACFRISTHVPTRGTTSSVVCPSMALLISTHVPTRGTTNIAALSMPSAEFQPTSPRGGRLLTSENYFSPEAFQPTSPRGGRRRIVCLEGLRIRFQPTSPRGGRREHPAHCPAGVYFNPRPHAGDDGLDSFLSALLGISTHVPTRGTTGGAA